MVQQVRLLKDHNLVEVFRVIQMWDQKDLKVILIKVLQVLVVHKVLLVTMDQKDLRVLKVPQVLKV